MNLFQSGFLFPILAVLALLKADAYALPADATQLFGTYDGFQSGKRCQVRYTKQGFLSFESPKNSCTIMVQEAAINSQLAEGRKTVELKMLKDSTGCKFRLHFQENRLIRTEVAKITPYKPFFYPWAQCEDLVYQAN